MRKKVIITAGGTGGHIFPAMALAKQLLREDPEIDLLFVGGGLGKNRYFSKESFSYKEVSCGTLSLRKPIKAIANSFRILRGIWQSKRLIRKFKPTVVVGFGSFYTLPLLLAAKSEQIPIILHEANRIPGKVNRFLSPYADLTGVHFFDTVNKLKGKAEEVAVPLREGYKLGNSSTEQAKSYFGLDTKGPVLLIFGGSQGALSMNRLVSEAVVLLNNPKLQILHFTGDTNNAPIFQKFYDDHGIPAKVKPFETRMDMAWQAADLMISRAGAGTIAEQVEFEVPGILIPFPFAADNHQESNADFMVEIVGGGIKYVEKTLEAKKLSESLKILLANDCQQLHIMSKAIKKYKLREKPRELSDIVRKYFYKKTK
jgi:UDP-N-acetylglucosamine--N-acetylmuramyl-(pentapeptide) pyrophosphoryl-undecaprenol N-acetylglucosamine transferase